MPPERQKRGRTAARLNRCRTAAPVNVSLQCNDTSITIPLDVLYCIARLLDFDELYILSQLSVSCRIVAVYYLEEHYQFNLLHGDKDHYFDDVTISLRGAFAKIMMAKSDAEVFYICNMIQNWICKSTRLKVAAVKEIVYIATIPLIGERHLHKYLANLLVTLSKNPPNRTFSISPLLRHFSLRYLKDMRIELELYPALRSRVLKRVQSCLIFIAVAQYATAHYKDNLLLNHHYYDLVKTAVTKTLEDTFIQLFPPAKLRILEMLRNLYKFPSNIILSNNQRQKAPYLKIRAFLLAEYNTAHNLQVIKLIGCMREHRELFKQLIWRTEHIKAFIENILEASILQQ